MQDAASAGFMRSQPLWTCPDTPCPPLVKADNFRLSVVFHCNATGRTSNAEEVHETVFAQPRESARHAFAALSGRYSPRTQPVAHQPALRSTGVPGRRLVLFYSYALSDAGRGLLCHLDQR